MIFGDLWTCSGDLRKSSEVFRHLRKCSGDLRKSSEGFVLSYFFLNWTVSAVLLNPY